MYHRWGDGWRLPFYGSKEGTNSSLLGWLELQLEALPGQYIASGSRKLDLLF